MKSESAWEILTEAVSQISYIMLLWVRDSRAREEAQCIANQENLRSVSSTYIRHLIMVCNSSSQVSVNTGLGNTIPVTYSHRQIHIILIFMLKINLKRKRKSLTQEWAPWWVSQFQMLSHDVNVNNTKRIQRLHMYIIYMYT